MRGQRPGCGASGHGRCAHRGVDGVTPSKGVCDNYLWIIRTICLSVLRSRVFIQASTEDSVRAFNLFFLWKAEVLLYGAKNLPLVSLDGLVASASRQTKTDLRGRMLQGP